MMSPTLSGVLAQMLLPSAIGPTFVPGMLEMAGKWAGWYGTAHGLVLFDFTTCTMLGAIILYVVHRTFLFEVKACESRAQVRQYNAVVEVLVTKRTQLLAESERFTRSTLDPLSVHRAVLDDDGFIIATNRTWQEFAVANSVNIEVGGKMNYLYVCDHANGPSAEESTSVVNRIRAIIRG